MLEKGGVAMMGAVEEEDETRGMASCVCLGLSCCVRGICRKVVDRRGSWWFKKFCQDEKLVKICWSGRDADDSSTSFSYGTRVELQVQHDRMYIIQE